MRAVGGSPRWRALCRGCSRGGGEHDRADLEEDPTTAKTPVEAARLEREAMQRAGLCAAMAHLAAETGFDAAKIYLVARAAGLGLSTFYKLFDSREACLLEAFEQCAE